MRIAYIQHGICLQVRREAVRGSTAVAPAVRCPVLPGHAAHPPEYSRAWKMERRPARAADSEHKWAGKLWIARVRLVHLVPVLPRSVSPYTVSPRWIRRSFGVRLSGVLLRAAASCPGGIRSPDLSIARATS